MGTTRPASLGSRLGLVLVAAVLFVGACGGSGEGDPDPSGTDGGGVAAEDGTASGDGSTGAPALGAGFDEAALPTDFPNELIPPGYDSAAYLDLGGTPTASFESAAPVAETVDHYTGLLGAPILTVEGDGGEQTAQWQSGAWVVSVVGSPDESLIGISRPGG